MMDYAKHHIVRPLQGFNRVAKVTTRIVCVSENPWHKVIVGIFSADIVLKTFDKHELVTVATTKLNRATFHNVKF